MTLILIVLYFGFDPVHEVFMKTHMAQRITLWAQHHP